MLPGETPTGDRFWCVEVKVPWPAGPAPDQRDLLQEAVAVLEEYLAAPSLGRMLDDGADSLISLSELDEGGEDDDLVHTYSEVVMSASDGGFPANPIWDAIVAERGYQPSIHPEKAAEEPAEAEEEASDSGDDADE